MKIYLIRHGKTYGNTQRRYIGVTDEPLCDEGYEQLMHYTYPKVDILFVSPLKRCRMTAEIVYPGQKQILCEDLREMNFGAFEGKNYEELKDEPEYIQWLESGGLLPFPQGESKAEFTKRCQKAFEECLEQIPKGAQQAAFVVHGGTIMAIMEKYGTPVGEYYKWQINNGEWIALSLKLSEKA